MIKKATLPQRKRKTAKVAKAELEKAHRDKIAGTIANLKQLKPKSPKAAETIALFIPGLKMNQGTTRRPGRKSKRR